MLKALASSIVARERFQRSDPSHAVTQGCTNAGLKLANAFGVQITTPPAGERPVAFA